MPKRNARLLQAGAAALDHVKKLHAAGDERPAPAAALRISR
jgi:hypothetical protein